MLENLFPGSKFLTNAFHYHLLELLVPSDFGVMPPLALRGTLRSGPKQLTDGFSVRIVLMVLFVVSCGIFSVRTKELFFLRPQHLKTLLFEG